MKVPCIEEGLDRAHEAVHTAAVDLFRVLTAMPSDDNRWLFLSAYYQSLVFEAKRITLLKRELAEFPLKAEEEDP
jgi:hypothetical protein